MRQTRTLIILTGLLLCSDAGAARLVCILDLQDTSEVQLPFVWLGDSNPRVIAICEVPDEGVGRGTPEPILPTLIDYHSTLGTVYRSGQRVDYKPGAWARAPDGTYYNVTSEVITHLNEAGGVDLNAPCIHYNRILHYTLRSDMYDQPYWVSNTVYEDQFEYESPVGISVEGGLEPCHPPSEYYLSDMEVRGIEGTDRHRLYVSTKHTHQIFYIEPDESNERTLYYEFPDGVDPRAWCGGEVPARWDGHFLFDNENNLLISSGNQYPGSVFKISGAGLDEVTGSGEEIYRRGHGNDFLMVGRSHMYFIDIEAPSMIVHRGLESRELGFFISYYGVIWEIIAVLPEIQFTSPPQQPHPFKSGNLRSWGWVWPYPRLENPSPPAPPPDLIVAQVEQGEPVFAEDGKSVQMPVRVTIRNKGMDVHQPFKIGVTAAFEDEADSTPLAFSLSGPSEERHVWQKGLRSSGEIALLGCVDLRHPKGLPLQGQKITMTATVDTCEGEQSMFAFCRVLEGNEENNAKTMAFKLTGTMPGDRKQPSD